MKDISLTAALIVTAVLGICFRTTRLIGIAACAALCLINPFFAVFILIGAGLIAFRLIFKR